MFDDPPPEIPLGVQPNRQVVVQGNDRADRLANKATLTSGFASQKICSVEELENKAKDITPSIALDNRPWADGKGPSSVRRTLEMFQRHPWGNF